LLNKFDLIINKLNYLFIKMSESEIENIIRAILGSISIIGIWICAIICLYKYAVYQEKQNKIVSI